MDLRDILQVGGLTLALIGLIGAFVRFVMAELDKRFAAQEAAREAGAKALRTLIAQHTAQSRSVAEQVGRLERDFLEWKAEMPLQYVRREDYVIGQSVIQARLDALYSKLEVVQLHVNRGAADG